MIIRSESKGRSYLPDTIGGRNPGRIMSAPFEVELNEYGATQESEVKDMLRSSGPWSSYFDSGLANEGTIIWLGTNPLTLPDPLTNGVNIELKSIGDGYLYHLREMPDMEVSLIPTYRKSTHVGNKLLITRKGDRPKDEVIGDFKVAVPPGYKYETFRDGYGGRFTLVQTEEVKVPVNESFFQTLAMASTQ